MTAELKIELIEWLDSQGVLSGWQDLKEFEPTMPTMKSIGFVVFENDQMVSLCGNVGDETPSTLFQGNGIMTIPKVCIQKRVTVTI